MRADIFFIAVKLALNATAHIFHHGFEISAQISLFIILAILGVGVVASLVKNSSYQKVCKLKLDELKIKKL